MRVFSKVARGGLPADLLIKNARLANVYSSEYEQVDVAIYQGRFVGMGSYDAELVFDAEGRVLIPAMIDGHIHIEDTMLTPQNFALEAAKHGTGTVFADPHEIANVMGVAGIEFMVEASRDLPVDFFYGAPSCVPASEYESPYEELTASDIKNMFSRGLTQHLGEMMNFPAIISGDKNAWQKIFAAGNVPLTGHAPGVTGKALNAYLTSGISSDHECTTLDEALEKLRRGMWLMIREGASFTDLRTLLPLIKHNPLTSARCMVVSDDITAAYLAYTGHMDIKMRIMLSEGIDPFIALRLVTLNPAEYFGLHDRGGIAPGKLADFALLNSDTLDDTFTVCEVWKRGIRTDTYSPSSEQVIPTSRSQAIIPPLSALDTQLHDGDIVNVIGIRPGSPVTDCLRLTYPQDFADTAKIVVVERHRATGRFSVGYVQGLGITRGAIASSVAHDAHNFVAVGADDRSIHSALSALSTMNGGLVCTLGENVMSSLPLPIAGLMNSLNSRDTAEGLTHIEHAASALGVRTPHAFMVLSFLCLSVIPSLKITDKGYIDITHGALIPLVVR